MPTQVRSQGNAIANVMSMFSQIASPYVVGSVSKRVYLMLSRPIHTMIALFVVILWRGFNHVKILDWNVNKSPSRLYFNAPKVE
jgi:hypothetical protein